MSVTFSVYKDGKFVEPEGFVQEYEHDDMYDMDFPTKQNPLEMNVANGNYIRLMELLGLEFDNESGYCGTWGDGSLQHVQERLKVILDGLKAMPEMDGGVPNVVEGNFTYCGVREGYFTERLSTLKTIVDTAVQMGAVVTFG